MSTLSRLKRSVPVSFAFLCLVGRVSSEPFSFIAVGDTPYNATQIEEFQRSIRHISRSDADFVLHVGDIKASREPCREEVYRHRAALYGSCEHPFIVLVGDNEFNDCENPEAALSLFRRYFASGALSLGGRKISLERQSEGTPRFPYPEHVRWERSGVHFVGLNVVGSNNHKHATAEWESRTGAGIEWLKESFGIANQERAAAVVVAFHANPFREAGGRRFPDSYAPIMEALIAEANRFQKPVLLIHGDTHQFRWDHPIPSRIRTGVMANLSRLEVFGSPDPHWVEVRVDPADPEVFSIQPRYLDFADLSSSNPRRHDSQRPNWSSCLVNRLFKSMANCRP